MIASTEFGATKEIANVSTRLAKTIDLIVESRMSVQLNCEIIINSVGNTGIEQVIVTAKDTHPAIWPDDEYDYYRNLIIIFNIIAYIVIGIIAYVIIYNSIKLYQEKFKNRKAKE